MPSKRAPDTGADSTQTQVKGLPHERDEAPSNETRPDRQQNARIGRKGADDVKRGVQDTTSAPQIDKAYDKVARGTED